MQIRLNRADDLRRFLSPIIEEAALLEFTSLEDGNDIVYNITFPEITELQYNDCLQTWAVRKQEYSMIDYGNKVIVASSGYGTEVLTRFMIEAMLGGANDMGKSGDMVKLLSNVILALSLGAIHAAVFLIDEIIDDGNETFRLGMPFTSNVKLLEVRNTLARHVMLEVR